MEICTLTHTHIRQRVLEAANQPWIQGRSWVGSHSNVSDDNHRLGLDAGWKQESGRLVSVAESWRGLATDSSVPLRILAANPHSRCGSPVPRVHPPPIPTPLGARAKSETLRVEDSRRTSRLPQIDLAIADETNSGRTSEPAGPAQCRPSRSGLAASGGVHTHCHG